MHAYVYIWCDLCLCMGKPEKDTECSLSLLYSHEIGSVIKHAAFQQDWLDSRPQQAAKPSTPVQGIGRHSVTPVF